MLPELQSESPPAPPTGHIGLKVRVWQSDCIKKGGPASWQEETEDVIWPLRRGRVKRFEFVPKTNGTRSKGGVSSGEV
ncbi:hypothetical protein AOLI_G00113460 [Acnodon oligacanthus]